MDIPVLLVCDDEEAMAEVVAEVAEEIGFDVHVATEADRFKDVFRENRVTGIVLDVVMPGTDGNDLLGWLAAQGSTCPVIIMSGYGGKYLGMAKLIGEYRGRFPIHTIEKPFMVDDLEEKLLALQ
ncbi:MAG: response regulator [Magnetovibrionaceae bacterium]